MKDYLGYEQARNKTHAQLYTDMVKLALGANNAVLVGHHIGFEADGDIATENEIPSADTLIFDHDIMKAIFGAMYRIVIRDCADVPCDQRDAILQRYFNAEVKRRAQAEVPITSWPNLVSMDT